MKLAGMLGGAAGIAAICGQSPKPPEPLKTPPVAYFAAHCARCHGKNGMNYADGFTKGKSDQTLTRTLAEMAAGPGGAPLSPPDLAAQVALHRAIDAGAPFIDWTEKELVIDTGTLAGEVLGTSSVKVRIGVSESVVPVRDGRWVFRFRVPMNPADARISATIGEREARMDLGKSAVSQIVDSKK